MSCVCTEGIRTPCGLLCQYYCFCSLRDKRSIYSKINKLSIASTINSFLSQFYSYVIITFVTLPMFRFHTTISICLFPQYLTTSSRLLKFFSLYAISHGPHYYLRPPSRFHLPKRYVTISVTFLSDSTNIFSIA